MSNSVAQAPGEVQPFTGEAYSNLTDLVREILNQTDEEFVPFDWETLKKTIGEDNLKTSLIRLLRHQTYHQICLVITRGWRPRPVQKISQSHASLSHLV